jgi:hypothetical protein
MGDSMAFEYLLQKLKSTDFSSDPFRHIYIEDFFSPEHLRAITGTAEINPPEASGDDDLFEKLFAAGYKIIDFPGCVTDKAQYIKWRRDRRVDHTSNTACEGFGMTLRLMSPNSPLISALQEFFVSDEFRDAIAEKFGIPLEEVVPDFGIQKYLDGYEISPHPDIRKKALTYMVNINPHRGAENLDHHTHYMTLRPERKYVQAFWEGNPKVDRCWVPWSWCETQSRQTKNNSIVIFAPSNNTIHGVKAHYDHLKGQRTQIYGNLWYKESRADVSLAWEDFVIEPRPARKGIEELVPKRAKALARKVLTRAKGKDPDVVIRGSF